MAAVPFPPPTVLWLPAHPATGAVSMDRYWRELERERRTGNAAPGDPVISCPLGEPPALSALGGRLTRAWNKYVGYPWKVRRASRRPGVKVVHVLDHSFAHLLAQVPEKVYRIATVHDLAPLRDGTGLSPGQVARFRRTVEHLRLADLVLADSRYSADEAIALLALDAKKVRVLPLGVDVGRFAPDAVPSTPPPWRERWAGRRVILSLGVAIQRKNLMVLPAVFRALKATNPDIPLALLRLGSALPGELLGALHSVLGKDGVAELGHVPEREVVAAYQHADALIFPSRIEGFGFPVLEAMAAGCPVVCTNVTSLPEVGGETALYFDPDEPAAAAAHLARLFNDGPQRSERIAAGLARVTNFSWSEHFRRLVEIYRSAGVPSAHGLAGTLEPVNFSSR